MTEIASPNITEAFDKQLTDFYGLQRMTEFYADFAAISNIATGTIGGLCEIHRYLFDGLMTGAGNVRTTEISNGIYRYIKADYLSVVFPLVDAMPEETLEQIVAKYSEMILLHPFSDGNGRSCRIWLDLMLMRTLGQRIDWGGISYSQHLWAQRESTTTNAALVEQVSKHLISATSNPCPSFKVHDVVIHYQGPVQMYTKKDDTDSLTLHITLPCESDLLPSQDGLVIQGEALFESRLI